MGVAAQSGQREGQDRREDGAGGRGPGHRGAGHRVAVALSGGAARRTRSGASAAGCQFDPHRQTAGLRGCAVRASRPCAGCSSPRWPDPARHRWPRCGRCHRERTPWSDAPGARAGHRPLVAHVDHHPRVPGRRDQFDFCRPRRPPICRNGSRSPADWMITRTSSTSSASTVRCRRAHRSCNRTSLACLSA